MTTMTKMTFLAFLLIYIWLIFLCQVRKLIILTYAEAHESLWLR